MRRHQSTVVLTIAFAVVVLLSSACEISVRNNVEPPITVNRDTSRSFSIGRLTTRPPATTPPPDTTVVSSNVTEGPEEIFVSPQDFIAQNNTYDITTPLGTMRILLYDETPRHRDNFKRLVEQNFYEGTTFHRVITNFMIQGGDPNSRDDNPFNDGKGGPGYTVPAEFNRSLFHKKGAVSAARQADSFNPLRSSNGSQFFIVQGQRFEPANLLEIEQYVAGAISDPNFTFTQAAREAYTTRGGYPMLDMQYTVFGELVGEESFRVLDKISSVSTDANDRPIDEIPMSIRPVVAQ